MRRNWRSACPLLAVAQTQAASLELEAAVDTGLRRVHRMLGDPLLLGYPESGASDLISGGLERGVEAAGAAGVARGQTLGAGAVAKWQ